MRIVVTGADGFIGKNLKIRLGELGYTELVSITRDTELKAVQQALDDADFVFHLAGVNRPQDPAEFATGNAGLTEVICNHLRAAGRKTPILLTSSTQASLENPYGVSKRGAEIVVRNYASETGAPAFIFRLTNVFGKWARPNYNSAVTTFCHNLSHGLPITVSAPDAPLNLVYIDDVVEAFVHCLSKERIESASAKDADIFVEAGPVYSTTVGAVADIIRSFGKMRTDLITAPVGTGLVRALYSTYVSYFEPKGFAYEVPRHADPRGVFVEMLKTPDCGQFSYFTAHPGVTRGEHYHHSKTEKFLVIKGTARFGFRHIVTNEAYELITHGDEARIVETVPGWTHNITNIGQDELIVMLWANEIFDRQRPDTISMKVEA
ncbi:NAD-dependent epimerase/dehydratase family protein [Massilia kyonggiensis]|nr:NAD-dependent epimerase/dehydratase family protein [Massilia kyonggiensis]